jgi:hypothetical protein
MRRLAYLLALAAACGSDHSGVTPDAPADIDAAPDSTTLYPVTFSYTPAWSGAVSVDVLGSFGQSTD